MCKKRPLQYSPQQRSDNAARWQLDRLAALATVLDPTDPGKQLGVGTGGPAQRVEEFRKKTQIVQKVHDRIRRMDGTNVELALAQACLGVAKVTHLLRACGAELVDEVEALRAFDRVQVGTFDRLAPGCDDEAREQATIGVDVGGLGMRKARNTAFPAVVASRVMAWPKVRQLGADLARAGLLGEGQLPRT
jgi:hypothetical protein